MPMIPMIPMTAALLECGVQYKAAACQGGGPGRAHQHLLIYYRSTEPPRQLDNDSAAAIRSGRVKPSRHAGRRVSPAGVVHALSIAKLGKSKTGTHLLTAACWAMWIAEHRVGAASARGRWRTRAEAAGRAGRSGERRGTAEEDGGKGKGGQEEEG